MTTPDPAIEAVAEALDRHKNSMHGVCACGLDLEVGGCLGPLSGGMASARSADHGRCCPTAH